MDNRPRGRETNVTGAGKGVEKRGSGLGTGPVGNTSGYSGRTSSSGSRPGTPAGRPASSAGRRPVPPAGGTQRSAGTRAGGSPLLKIIIAAVILLGGGGGILGGVFGGGGSSGGAGSGTVTGGSSGIVNTIPGGSGSSSAAGQLGSLSSLLGGLNSGTSSSGWSRTANTGKLDNTVAPGARAKRAKILGNGQDTVTIMVYMCGTDLESKSGMASYDLQEMINATLSDKVNLLVYTGGCKAWKNNVVSSSVNQIYKVENGSLTRMESDMGSAAMTNPATLTSFINWCTERYPANRTELIFWDHGGGSLSGYGYDEKNAMSGSMTLKNINKALKDAGTTFDFIGFDACLMATAENALMLSDYADYLIASEETEPGIGWYYTNWLTKLSQNTSMPTTEIGKNIVDDFVDTCATKCAGQKATLSVVDLAELSATAPEVLTKFAAATSDLLKNDQYETVSTARSGAREFAASNRIDQVDLVDLACNMGTAEGKALADALLGAVKYNRTADCITDAYGLSIYFPYQKLSSVDNAVAAYDAIGMDSAYARCIQEFASLETAGQAVSGGAASPLGSLTGIASASSAGTPVAGADMISSLLSGLLGGSLNGVSGLSGGNSGFLGKSLDVGSAAAYLADNRFDPAQLRWTTENGKPVMRLSEDQWRLVQSLELNVFFDDGEGYIDLGLDNVYDFTDDGALIGDFNGTWLAINDQPVAYYHMDTYDNGTDYRITGRVPVLLNGDRAELILVFDNANPYGVIAGARFVYADGETETVAKSTEALEPGDTLDFLCDYYAYDGTYLDTYLLGETMTVTENMVISNVYIDAAAASPLYRFTDIYHQEYWSPAF